MFNHTVRSITGSILLTTGTILAMAILCAVAASPREARAAAFTNISSAKFAPVKFSSLSSSSITTPRYRHTATTLNNGKVLFAGGVFNNFSTPTNKAQLYDPRLGAFAPAEKTMNVARTDHTATMLQTGQVLLAGGKTSSAPTSATTDMILYDPVSDTFISTPTVTSLITARYAHTATRLKDGRVLIVGGFSSAGTSLASTEICNQTVSLCMAGANLTTARAGHAAVLMQDGRVAIIGGASAPGSPLTSIEIFNPLLGTTGTVGLTGGFTTAPSLTTARARLAAILRPDGSVLIIGGAGGTTTELLNAAATIVSNAPNLVSQTFEPVVTLLPNGDIVVIGGYPFMLSNSIQILRGSNSIFEIIPGINTFDVVGHTATLVPDGSILVVGGKSQYTGTIRSTSESLTFAGRSTLLANALPAAREYHTSTLLPNGKVFIAGGYGGSITYASAAVLSTTALYDPSTGSFTAGPPLNTPRSAHSATMLPNGNVLLIGGNTGTGYAAAPEVYDYVANTLTPASAALAPATAAMAVPRANHRATLLADGRVLITGGVVNTTETGVIEIFTPGQGFTTAAGALTTARQAHAAVLLKDGNVLIAGGKNQGTPLNSAEVYLTATGQMDTTFTSLMSNTRGEPAAALLPSDNLLIMGSENTAGTSADIYHFSTRTFSPVTGGGFEVRATATPLADGRVLKAGGAIGTAASTIMEVFDPATYTFNSANVALTTARESHTATLLRDGTLLIAGGFNGANTLYATAELYSLDIPAARRSSMTSYGPMTAPIKPTLTGNLLAGDSEASGGMGSSGTNYPVLAIQRVQGGSPLFYADHDPAQQWKELSPGAFGFYPATFPALPHGMYSMTFIGSGVPGTATLFYVSPTLGTTPAAGATVSFPDTSAGSISATQSISISNNGNADMKVAGISLGGGNATDFSFTNGTCSAFPFTLTQGLSCTIDVKLSPLLVTPPGAVAATLTIHADAPEAATPYSFNLSGNVTAAPVLSVTTAGTGTGTVTSDQGGIACPTACSATYAGGQMVNLIATPGGSSFFAGWTGACTGSGACSVTMSAAQSVTATFTSITVPGAPTIGTAKAGNTMATVSFTPPASDGGSPITGYTVTSSPGGLTTTGTVSPITITGLTNGTPYTFTVTAANIIGTSTPSTASGSVTPKSLYPWYAYVPNRGVAPGFIQSYSVNQSNGALTALGTFTTDAAGDTDSIAVDPQGRFVYVTNSTPNTVSAFKINQADGSLTPTGTITTPGSYPDFVTVDPAGKFAYVTDGTASGTIYIYSINQISGILTLVNTSTSGQNPYMMAIDPTGRFAYAAVANSAYVAMYTVNAATGALAPNGTVAIGQGAVADSPVGVAIDPTGRFAYVADRGTGNDRIFQFSIDQSTGVLSTIGTGIVPTGAGTTPLRVAVDPTGRFVYTANNSGKSVSMFSINQTTGALTSIGANMSVGANIGPIELNINPAGTVLYVSDGGAPQGVAAFAINPSTGALTPVAGSPFASTGQPNGVGFAAYGAAPAPLVIATTTLPATTQGRAYSQQIGVTGGLPPYPYVIASGALPSGITLSSSGLLSGTATVSGTFSFSVAVTDGQGVTATQPLNLVINPMPAITTSALPGATAGIAYGQTITASGGTVPLIMTVSAGALPPGMTLTTAGSLFGTPSANGIYNFTVTATDTAGATASQAYSIAVATTPGAPTVGSATAGSAMATISFTPPASDGGSPITGYTVTSSPGGLTATGPVSPITITGLTNGTAYTFTVTAANAVGAGPVSAASNSVTPQPTFVTALPATVTFGSQLVTTGSAPQTLTITNNGASATDITPAISGTNTADFVITPGSCPSTPPLTLSPGGSCTMNIAFAPSAGPSGTRSAVIALTTTEPGLPTIPVTLSGTALADTTPPAVTAFTLPAVSPSTTVSILSFTATDAESGVAGYAVSESATPPGSWSPTAPASYTFGGTGPRTLNAWARDNAGNISAVASAQVIIDVQRTVSGTLNYAGSTRAYVYIANTSKGNPGAAVLSGPAPFTINGVATGTFPIIAFQDVLGTGTLHQSDPYYSGTINTSAADVTGLTIGFSPQTITAPLSPKYVTFSPENGGGLVLWDTPKDANGAEIADSYTIYWSTTPNPGPANMAGGGSRTITAFDDGHLVISGLTNGINYYFSVTASNSLGESAPAPSFGPVQTGAVPATGVSVSGAVTFATTPTGPLYVVLDDRKSAMYTTRVPSPASPQSYTISGVPDGVYQLFAFIDLNSNGIVDAGDIRFGGNGLLVQVSGTAVSGINLTLPATGATASVTTGHWLNPTLSQEGYNISIRVYENLKKPVSASVTSGKGIIGPVSFGNRYRELETWFSLPLSSPPVTGDSYAIAVTYSDGTSETINASVTGVLNDFAQPSAPAANATTVSGPQFSWLPPATAPAYTHAYELRLNSTNGSVWNSETLLASGQSSAPYNYDQRAFQTSLTNGQSYAWSIAIRDGNGNYTSIETPFIFNDTTPPAVLGVTPVSGSGSIPVTEAPTVSFDDVIDWTTLTASTFTLTNGATGKVTYDAFARTATFVPSAPLAPGTPYTASLNGLQDIAGNILPPYSWTFTTVTPSYTVTSSVSGIGGTITPPSSIVNSGTTASFTVTPDPGYAVSTVTSSCGGTWSGTSPFVTGPVTANCSVTAAFLIQTVIATGTTTTITAGSDGKTPVALTLSSTGSTVTIPSGTLMTDALGNPLDFILTAGQASDVGQADALLQPTPAGAEALLGDKGYDGDASIRAGMHAVIPPRSNRIAPRGCDWFVYKERHLIECFFGKIKHYRRVFSRFEKLARNYMGFIRFVSALIWLR